MTNTYDRGGRDDVDPVSLIMGALAAGAVAGAQGTATDAVKDAYAGLKALLRRRFGGRASAEVALDRHDAEPEPWAVALEAELVDAGADHDEAVIAAAQKLMALLDSASSRDGHRFDLRGVQGAQVGDHNLQTNNFTTPR